MDPILAGFGKPAHSVAAITIQSAVGIASDQVHAVNAQEIDQHKHIRDDHNILTIAVHW